MASKKISQLPAGVSLGVEDLFIIARSGLNYSLTGQNVIDAVTFDPTTIDNAITALQNDRLKLDGSNSPMTGTLQMDTHKVTSTYVPANPEDLTNKLYADSMVPLLGGTMTGLLLLSGDPVASLGAVTLQQLNAAVAGITPPVNTNDLIEGSDGSAVAGSGIEVDGNRYYYTQARWEGKWSGKNTDDLSEGIVNKYFTTVRFDTLLSTQTTDNIVEGSTNLYYTVSRARSAISATAPIFYDNVTGVLTYNGEETSFGLPGEIPFVNATSNDFDYNSDFIFDGVRLIVTPGIGGGTSVLIGDATTGENATNVTDSVLVGTNAGNQAVSNTGLTLIGHSAGSKELGNGNTYIGDETGGSTAATTTVTNTENTIVGYQSAGLVDTGGWNTAIGSTSLMDLTTGSGNIAIGYLAGNGLDTGSGNIYIGANVDASSGGVSDELKIGNGTIVPISADLSTGAVTINEAYTLPTVDAAVGLYVISSDGVGNLTWGTTVYSVTAGDGLDVVGPGGVITTAGTIEIEDTLVTPGSYTNADITVDQKGRITAAATGTGPSGDGIYDGSGTLSSNVIVSQDDYDLHFQATNTDNPFGVRITRTGNNLVGGPATYALQVINSSVDAGWYGTAANLVCNGANFSNTTLSLLAINGTTHNHALIIGHSSGNVGIGVSNPDETLELGQTAFPATFKFVDGNESVGYVLTSDANGVATWQTSGAGGTPAGATGDFQWNNAGAFAGASPLVTDGSTIGIGTAESINHFVIIDGTTSSASRMIHIDHTETSTASYGIEMDLDGVSPAFHKFGFRAQVNGGDENEGYCVALSTGGYPAPIASADIGFHAELGHTSSTNYGVYIDTTSANSSDNIGIYIDSLNGAGGEAYGLVVENGASIIGGTTPDASAIFQIDSTTQGFLPPRMTNTQMLTIPDPPPTGLMVYDLTNNQWMGYNGTGWVILG